MFLPTGPTGQPLERFLAVSFGAGGGDAFKHPTMHRAVPTTKREPVPCVERVLMLRKLAIEVIFDGCILFYCLKTFYLFKHQSSNSEYLF